MNNNTDARLELFRQAINAQADAEAAEIVRSAAEKRSAIAKEKSERSSGAALADVREEYSRTAAELKRELSRCDCDMKKAVLQHRCELVSGLFAEIRGGLEKFTASPDYTGYLSAAAARAAGELGSEGTVIRVRPADVSTVEKLTDLPVQPDAGIILGGLTAYNTAGGLCLDLTLDSRLRDEEAAFTGIPELRL